MAEAGGLDDFDTESDDATKGVVGVVAPTRIKILETSCREDDATKGSE